MKNLVQPVSFTVICVKGHYKKILTHILSLTAFPENTRTTPIWKK